MAFDLAADRLTTVSADGVIRRWALPAGSVRSPIHTVQLPHRFADTVAISPDGKRVATASRLKSRSSKAPGGNLEPGECAVLVRDPKTGEDRPDVDYDIRVWDRETGAAVGPPLKGHTWFVTSLAFNPDGSRLASGGADAEVRVWDLSGMLEPRLLRVKGFVEGLTFSPDGQQLVIGDRRGGLTTGQWGIKNQSRPENWAQGVVPVASDSGAGWIAAGALTGPIRVWNSKSEEVVELRRHHPHLAGVQRITFAPHSGNRLASWGDDGTVRVWDLDAARLARIRTGFDFDAHDLTPDGKWLAGAAADGTVRVWDLLGGGEPAVRNVEMGTGTGIVRVSLAAGGRCVAAESSDGVIRVRNLTGEDKPVVRKGGPGLMPLALSPAGSTLAVSDPGGTVRVIDLTTPGERRLGTPSAPTWPARPMFMELKFSPEGRWLAAVGLGGEVRVWDLTSGVESLLPESGVGGRTGSDPVNVTVFPSIAFSSDGTRLAAGGGDGIIRVWEMGPGANPAP